jgi:hypothetical protein
MHHAYCSSQSQSWKGCSRQRERERTPDVGCELMVNVENQRQRTHKFVRSSDVGGSIWPQISVRLGWHMGTTAFRPFSGVLKKSEWNNARVFCSSGRWTHQIGCFDCIWCSCSSLTCQLLIGRKQRPSFCPNLIEVIPFGEMLGIQHFQ